MSDDFIKDREIAKRISLWDSLRSPDIQMPQREAVPAAGFKAVRMG